MKIKTYLPIFTGFYGSIYEPNEENEIDYINELREEKNLDKIDYDDCDFNYSDYFLEVAKGLVNEVENQMKEFVNSIEFEELKSPKFYNYSNDSINVKINPNKKSIINYIRRYKDEWKKYLLENYKSCDGFI